MKLEVIGLTKKKMTDNELIAEFMGHSTEPLAIILNYSESWDILMPVVDKINQLDYPVMILGCRCEITLNDKTIISDNSTSIKTVYMGVVEFIKWHNGHNK